MKFNTTKLNKTSIWGGVGSAVFLVLLMALMPFGGIASAPMDDVGSALGTDAAEAKVDPFALPAESTGTIELEDRDSAKELLGMRGLTQKAYVEDNGDITVLTFDDPIHYVADGTTWEEINTNVVATPYGWEVSDNLFKTSFAGEVGGGVAIQANPSVDPIIVGIQPMLVTLDITGTSPEPVHVGPTEAAISTGGNTIRYPLAQGYDLDYVVESTKVKQNLIIRDQPVLKEGQEWFGLSEIIRMPVNYALYVGEVAVGQEIIMTQEPLQVRHIETGELLVEFPTPTVFEPGNPEVYIGTYFVSVVFGGQVFLTTAVESSWLMDMNRSYPINLDPTIKVTQGGTGYGSGYCYIYYANCYDNAYAYTYRYYNQIRYTPWHRYDFQAQNLGSTAYPTKVEWKMYRQYLAAGTATNTATAISLQNCGTDVRYNWGITTSSCSGDISANLLTGYPQYGTTKALKLQSSIGNSQSLGSIPHGTGWKTVSICNSQASCLSSANGMSIFNSLQNGSIRGVGVMPPGGNLYHYTYTNNNGNLKSHYAVSYGGAVDTAAPMAMNYAAYTGITTYKEGARTFFIDLKDNAGIDTTASGGPFMYYNVDNGTYIKVSASTIGTCSTTTARCQFRATTSALTNGDYVTYYWEYSDLASTTNTGTTPSGGSSSPHWFQIDAIDDAGSAKKFQVQLEQRSAYSAFAPQKYFDQLMTYYDSSDEFVFEFDTSDCGTGSQSCFYTSNYYFYQMWKMKWTTTPSYGYNGFGGTLSGEWNMMADVDEGFITLTADDGPGMNLIYLYDSSANRWSVTGLDTSTGIDEPLSGGITKTKRGTYGYTDHYNIKLDNIYGTVGKFDFNGSYSSSRANWLCQGSNGFVYFFRSSQSNPLCTSGYFYAYSASYRWTGFAIGTGYYGRMSADGGMSYKVSKVAPEPDRTAPTMDHSPLLDSHSKTRTITTSIVDGGEPPSGLNTNTTIGVGPTLYYRQSGVTEWFSKPLNPIGKTRPECRTANCEWSADLDSDSGAANADFMERGKTIEYKLYSQDTNSDIAGSNAITSAMMSFEVGDPNKVFVVEWHDLGYFNNQYACTFQVLLYDVTNEIEFKYDTGCSVYYDYATIGYQNQARNIGATIDNGVEGYLAGSNAFNSNYRIATDGNAHGYEKFSLGVTPITNYKVAIQGSSGGLPTGYNCVNAIQWNTWKAGCDANIDLPDGFSFDYFGTTFDGDSSNSRVFISRFGAMYLKHTSSTSPQRAMTTWYTNMPDLPYSSNTMSRPNLLAPWWGYYSSYYCYTSGSVDCSVRYRTMPFEGKGTDVDASSLTDVDWDMLDSPIRVNPPGDYLSITGDMNIAAGVVIQVANGKGISIDGSCSNMNLLGNTTDHILFEGQGGQTWKGMAFTAGCSSGTDERHNMEFVDFVNTSDAAISAGSRHGVSPSTNSNVGNFTMTDVTFKNVGSAVSHGSGDGTSFTMVNVDVEDSSGSCFDFPTDAVVTMNDITMDGCNTDGSSTGGAIVNDAGSTGGSLWLEDATIVDSYVNLISSDLASITIINVTATHSATQSGVALEASAGATGSSLSVDNMDVADYGTVTINVLDSYSITDSDFGDANIGIAPGGASSTASGAHGDSAILDGVVAGALSMARTAPAMNNVDLSGALTVTGNSPTTNRIEGVNVDADGVSFQGCGYTYFFTDMDLDAGGADSYLSSSCSSSNAPNSITIDTGTISTSSSSNNVIYARNSRITLGSVDITGQTSGSLNAYVAKASSNGIISMIDVTWRGNDCANSSGWTGPSVCWVTISSSSGQIFFGGTASIKVWKNIGNSTNTIKAYKAGHIVNAEVVDGSGSALFIVGRHITDSNGEAQAWVLSESLSGIGLSSTKYVAHNLFAYGPAGVNETFTFNSWYPGWNADSNLTNPVFGVGDSIELRLYPAPVDLGDANMDCSWLASNSTIKDSYDPQGTGTYTFEANTLTLSADLVLDNCNFILKGATLKIKSDATTSPTLTVSGGSWIKLIVEESSQLIGTIRAQSSSYPLHLDIQNGLLWIDGGIVKDVAQSGTTGSALYIGTDATLKITNGGKIYGLAANSDDMATVEINGGTLEGDDGTIINTGGTGTGIWFENTMSGMANLAITGAAVGIKSHNAAPQLDGFTVSGSDVGVSLYGGMTLPTIYRSTSLSGMNAGWNTYSFDISTFLDKDYVQLGYNSIWAGGNAHPRYNYATSKYYMMTDRVWVEFALDTNGDGNADVTYNHSDRGAGTRTSPGYYNAHNGDGVADGLDGAGSDTSGEYAGYNYWDCNLYGYVQNPAYRDYGYYYYLTSANYLNQLGLSGAYAQSGSTYYGAGAEPTNFGYRWEAADDLSTAQSLYYPYHYWGYYYNAFNAYNNPLFYPPEGFVGLFGTYNICMDYYYTGYSPGLAQAGNRIAMPIIDMNNEGDGDDDRNNVPTPQGKIVGATLNIDFFHNRADNYQDRIEIVVRSSDNIVNLVDQKWAREAGTPLFKDGVIDDSDVGIEVGGGTAAGLFKDVVVNSPVSSGMVITGSAFTSVDGLTVTGGDYCVRTSLTAAGRVDLDGLNCQNQAVAGVSYQRDISGSFSGSISGSAGAAVEYGSATTADHDFTSLMLSGNSIGMIMGGKGAFTLTDSDFDNTNYDITVPGSSAVTFIDGEIDDNKTSVTGSGIIKRARSLEITLEEITDGNTNTVEDAKILLMAGDSSIQGSAITDASGKAGGILYTTMERTSAGATWPNLGGYSAVTVAEIDYNNGYGNNNAEVMDFRYKSVSVTLDPDAASTDTILLEQGDIIPYRVCYSFSSLAYAMLAMCPGMLASATKAYDNDGDGTDDAWEYGYFGATPKDMKGKTVLMDVPFMYIPSDTGSSDKNNWSNTNLIITGNYDFYGYQRWASTYPYNSYLMMDNVTAVSLTTTQLGVAAGVMFGYFAWSDINPWITNSTIVGLSGIAAARESSNWDPDHFVVADNTFIRAGGPGSPKNSFGYQEMCIVNSGIHDAIVTNNVISGCPISIMIRNIVYTGSFSQSVWGPDNMIIEGNTFLDTGTISTWFYFSYGDDISVKNNTFGGSTAPTYQVYVQSPYTVGLVVDGNTFTSGDQPIYIRGGLDYNIKNNDITGNRNQAHPGIYTLNGYGSISGNTLTDADGGIMIDGIRSGQSLSVTDNTIGPSAGRTAPGAVGIWAEDCGASTLVTGGNIVTTVMNGLVIDGCEVYDTGSKFIGTGGVGGASWSVDVMASYYSPENQTIGDGDSVRWRAKEYYNGTLYTHTVTASANQNVTFDSGTMNLGSTFAYTFVNAGSYEYYCKNHNWMFGNITVTAGGSASFTANGINVISSGNKMLTLNGTEVGGYSTGVSMSGGSLELTGGARIAGVGYALYLDGVDVTTSGANLDANGFSGIGLYLTNGGSLDLNELSTGAAYGVYTDGVDFNWNGGIVSGGTALYADNRAEGDFQNITFDTDLILQIYAGSNTIITSVGNSLDSTKLGIDPTAIIHEANLLTLATDRDEDYNVSTPATASEDIGLMITSTDGTKAAFVSSTFRDTSPTIDGDVSEWAANPLNPSDDMMPGVMSGDGTSDMLVTWDAQNLYLAITGADMDNGDLQVYIGHGASGTSDSLLWDNMQHGLPFLANYAFWAEDGSNPPKDGDTSWTWGLKSWSTGTNTWSDISEGCTWSQDSAYIGWSANDVTEVAIPWSCIGSPIGDIRLLATVLNEGDGEVDTVYPNPDDFTLDGGNESFSGSLSITVGQLDLGDGNLDDYRLIYRSYIGSTTAGPAKNYDVMVVGNAPCEEDWGNIYNISMDQNFAGSITIERACPFIAAPSFVTVTTVGDNLTGTGYMVGFEDMPMQTIPLTPYGIDMQTSAIDIHWSVTDHPNPMFAPTTLLTYYQWGVKGETFIGVDHDDNESTPDYPMPIGDNQAVNLTVLPNQFGYYNVKLTITDEHGLSDVGYLTVIVLPINDAPIIWNFAHTNYDLTQGFTPYGAWSAYGLANVPVFITDSDGNENVVNEGHGTKAYKLGNKIFGLTGDTTYIYDQLNEQPQFYTWGASVAAACEAFSVSISNGSEILINETRTSSRTDFNAANPYEKGGECDITLTLSDDGTDAFPIHYIHPLLGLDIYGWTFNDATPKAVKFRINPVNDAPYIHSSFDASLTPAREIVDGNGDPINLEWAITVLEDTTDVAKLTFNLSQMKGDVDHENGDLYWTFQRHYVETTGSSVPQLQCEYDYYFSNIAIVGDEMSFTLIPDATTNAPPEQVDKMDAGGIHQSRPNSQEGYCFIEMYVHDSNVAPAYIPNYDFDTASYNTSVQSADHTSAKQILKIKVDNTPEPVPNYFFDDVVGFNFHGVSFVISGTEVPMSVEIVAGGDAPPNSDGTYKYDHILEVTFKSDGHAEGDKTAGRTIFVDPPEHGERITVKHPGVPVMDESRKVSVYVDIKTCLAETCPAPSNVSVTDFVNDNPEAHVCAGNTTSWSCPGLFQELADRRPQLEDQDFDNNIMTNMVAPDNLLPDAQCGSFHPYLCLSTGQVLPEIVATRGLASVPSFAPSIMMVSLMGLFVGAMLAMGRRDEDDEDREELEDDDAAVSPVIATILMVAITVVLSGVIYVWASSLANTDQKTVPRLGMKLVEVNPDSPDGYWRLDVTSAKTELASQGVIVQVEWAGGVYQTVLTNTTNYGFVPSNVPDKLRENAPVIVTFADKVNCDADGKNCVTTFGVGDSIMIGSHDTNGNKLSDVKVTIRYDPGLGTATLLQTFRNLH